MSIIRFKNKEKKKEDHSMHPSPNAPTTNTRPPYPKGSSPNTM